MFNVSSWGNERGDRIYTVFTKEWGSNSDKDRVLLDWVKFKPSHFSRYQFYLPIFDVISMSIPAKNSIPIPNSCDPVNSQFQQKSSTWIPWSELENKPKSKFYNNERTKNLKKPGSLQENVINSYVI